MNISHTNQTVTSTDATQPSEGISAVGNPFLAHEKLAAEWPQGEEKTKTEAELVQLAKGAADAIHAYGSAEMWRSVGIWGRRLQAIIRACPNNKEIQAAFVRGTAAVRTYDYRPEPVVDKSIKTLSVKEIVVAIPNYWYSRSWDNIEACCIRLQAEAQTHPDDAEIQGALAKGMAKAINAYGASKKWEGLQGCIIRLQGVSQTHPENKEIQEALIHGMVAAAKHYCRAEKWRELEACGVCLQAVTQTHPDNQEIKRALAYAEEKRDFAATRKNQIALARSPVVKPFDFRKNTEAQADFDAKGLPTVSVRGALQEMNRCGAAEMWDEIEVWDKCLQSVLYVDISKNKVLKFGSLWPTSSETAQAILRSAGGALHAMDCYGRAQKWDKLEAWGNRLQSMVQTYLDDKETKKALRRGYSYALSDKAMLHLRLAEGAVKAMDYYSRAEKWDETEVWNNRLQTVVQAHPCDKKIQECLRHSRRFTRNVTSPAPILQAYLC